MPRRRPRPRSRSVGSGMVLLCAAVFAVAPALASCAYSFDDGLPPLGARTPPPAQRYPPPPPSAGVTEPPPVEWTPEMMSSWALETLPDTNGVSFAFGYGLALPGQPVLASAVVPTGTLVLEYECRGADTAHMTLSVAGSALVDSDYACGRVWVRTIVVPDGAVAEVRASATGGTPSAYAFRIVKR